MENMPGGSVDKAKLTDTQKAKAIISICKALEYLHAKEIMHRDIKPSNVLLTEDNDAKISDFGSSRAIELGLTQTAGAQTTLYGAPELHDGGSATLASDVWSLGLVIYEILEQMPMFDVRMPLMRLLMRMASDERPPLPASASPELQAVIAGAWNADPAKRPTAAEICARLSAVGWKCVRGADPAEIKAHLARFPLDLARVTKEELLERATKAETALAEAKTERDQARAEVGVLKGERDQVKVERDALKVERDQARTERDEMKVENAKLTQAGPRRGRGRGRGGGRPGFLLRSR
jgi:serine/threonine protein kinase